MRCAEHEWVCSTREVLCMNWPIYDCISHTLSFEMFPCVFTINASLSKPRLLFCTSDCPAAAAPFRVSLLHHDALTKDISACTFASLVKILVRGLCWQRKGREGEHEGLGLAYVHLIRGCPGYWPKVSLRFRVFGLRRRVLGA